MEGHLLFYVHYVDCKLAQVGAKIRKSANDMLYWISVNKRLDDWVTEEHMDTRKVQFPRKDGGTTGQNTGVTTPKRFISNSMGPLGLNSTVSRPTSPKAENDTDMVNGNTVMAAAIQKKISRKRKVSSDAQLDTPLIFVQIYCCQWFGEWMYSVRCCCLFAILHALRHMFVSHLPLPLRISHDINWSIRCHRLSYLWMRRPFDNRRSNQRQKLRRRRQPKFQCQPHQASQVKIQTTLVRRSRWRRVNRAAWSRITTTSLREWRTLIWLN